MENVNKQLLDAMKELVSIVEIHSEETDNNFAWAELLCARQAIAAAEQAQQAEPVAWQFYQDGKWWNGDDRIKDHRKNTEDAGIPTRDLFAQPPAVAVPDEMESVHDTPFMSADTEPEIAYRDGWNACRDAMLAAMEQPK